MDDDVVMIVDPQLQRAHWPIGRVVKLNVSSPHLSTPCGTAGPTASNTGRRQPSAVVVLEHRIPGSMLVAVQSSPVLPLGGAP